MIVITGASGAVGGPAIRQLVKRGAKLRAFTSKPASAERLKSQGVVETVLGDLRNEADVARVLEGATAVLHIPPAMQEDEAEIGKRVVAAARRAKVGHIVYISCAHSVLRTLAHHWHKLLVEEAVCESEIPYTILQPSMFMQNLRFIWRGVLEHGVLQWPWDTTRRFNFIDADDLGEVIAIALTDDRLRNGTFEICGPQSLTVEENAKIVSEEWGRPVRAATQDRGAFAAGMTAMGASPWAVQNFLAMARYYDEHGYDAGNPLVATAILGRAPGDYRSFVRRFLAAQKAS